MALILLTILIAVLNVALGYVVAERLGLGPSASFPGSAGGEAPAPSEGIPPSAQGNGEEMLREVLGTPGK